MSAWDVILAIGNFVLGILAGWKVYDLLFPSKRHTYTVKDRILDFWAEQYVLVRFFAEFTNKQVKGLSEYEPATPDIYEWLRKEFQDWANRQK